MANSLRADNRYDRSVLTGRNFMLGGSAIAGTALGAYATVRGMDHIADGIEWALPFTEHGAFQTLESIAKAVGGVVVGCEGFFKGNKVGRWFADGGICRSLALAEDRYQQEQLGE